jgi:dihydroorotase
VENVLIQDGKIFGITKEVPRDWASAECLDATGRLVLPGLICLRTHVSEPGFEWREDIASVSRAAAAGGFTTVCARPDTDPVNDVRAVTEQIVTRSQLAPGAHILPVGAATLGLKGEHLSEMGDLRDAGCVAVSTGEMSLRSTRMMRRVFEYARSVGLPVFSAGQDAWLSKDTVMNEGRASIRLGMSALPPEGEATALHRDGLIAHLAETSVHFQRVSTAAGVTVLRRLLDDGIAVTAGTTPHHLCFTEDEVATFDTNTRVDPPLRSQEDVAAVRQALLDGVITTVSTDHTPLTSIEKMVEYEFADPGTVGLETALGALLDLVRQGALTLDRVVSSLTTGPAAVLGHSQLGRIREGGPASLIVVEPSVSWSAAGQHMLTSGQNQLFEGRNMVGRVEYTFVDGMEVDVSLEEKHGDFQ